MPLVLTIQSLPECRRYFCFNFLRMVSSIMDLINGMWAAQSVATMTRLGVPELLKNGTSLSIESIALELKLHFPSLKRLLRAVACTGVISITPPDLVELTSTGYSLLSEPHNRGQPSLRAYLMAVTLPGHTKPWEAMEYSVRTGNPSALPQLGAPIWEYYDRNVEEGKLFAEAMGSFSSMAIPAILKAYPLAESLPLVLVDVGGSHGALLSAILEKYENAEGIVFDLPMVIESAATPPSNSRMSLVPGDFFKAQSIPSNADFYLLKHILHDWSDKEAISILKNVRESMKAATSKVLIVEMVIPDDDNSSDQMPFFMDLNMMLLTGGKERTIEEYKSILKQAGLVFSRAIKTESPVYIIEAFRE